MIKSLLGIVALALSAPVLAQVTPGGGCGDLCQPPAKPALPGTIRYDGYFEYPSMLPGDDGYMAGTFSNRGPGDTDLPTPYWFLGNDPNSAVHHAFGSSAVVLGSATDAVVFSTIAPSFGQPQLLAVATKQLPNNAGVAMNLTYAVKLTAPDMATADLIAASLANGPFGAIYGGYANHISGAASSILIAETSSLAHSEQFRSDCTDIPTLTDLSGCTADNYNVGLHMSRGDLFEGGSALDFYGQIHLSVSAFTYFDGSPGMASAFIDPTIRLSSALRGINGLTLTSGGVPTALAFVPEPAQWAMLIGGFGMIGGYARTRRSLKPA